MAEVHEQTQLAAGCAEIVEQLSSMFIYQLGNCFDFDDDLVVANEIRTEFLNQSATAVLQCLLWLREKWNPLEFQLNFQTLVVDRFVKTAALVLINGKTGPDDVIAFVLVNQFCFFFFCCLFVWFVG